MKRASLLSVLLAGAMTLASCGMVDNITGGSESDKEPIVGETNTVAEASGPAESTESAQASSETSKAEAETESAPSSAAGDEEYIQGGEEFAVEGSKATLTGTVPEEWYGGVKPGQNDTVAMQDEDSLQDSSLLPQAVDISIIPKSLHKGVKAKTYRDAQLKGDNAEGRTQQKKLDDITIDGEDAYGFTFVSEEFNSNEMEARMYVVEKDGDYFGIVGVTDPKAPDWDDFEELLESIRFK